jgi:hypothetical protein
MYKLLVKDQTVVRFPRDTCEQDLDISSDGLTIKSKSPQAWLGGRANVGVKSGACYFEVKVDSAGLCRVGWAMPSATPELGTDSKSL